MTTLENTSASPGPATPLAVAEVEPAVSWPAISAGAVVALAVGLLLTVLGAGFGLQFGAGGLATRNSLAGFTPEVGGYAMATQVIAGALGGYVAGRLRPTWAIAHGDEAHFRDTAHGLIAWAVATVLGVVLAAGLLIPYAEALAGPTLAASAPVTAVQTERAAHIAAQASFFTAVGMLLSAFVAAVAGRLGGEQTEGMHAKRRGI